LRRRGLGPGEHESTVTPSGSSRGREEEIKDVSTLLLRAIQTLAAGHIREISAREPGQRWAATETDLLLKARLARQLGVIEGPLMVTLERVISRLIEEGFLPALMMAPVKDPEN
jgi:hypothetical protein